MLEHQINLPLDSLKDKDKTLTLANVTWKDYEILADNNQRQYRLSYYKNTITIMSPSRNHEKIVQTIVLLVNAYCRHFKIPYFALGSSDIRNPTTSAKQPDAQYCFNTEKSIPDLAIEVVFSSGGKNDLKKYADLQVKEVWIWQNQKLKIFCHENNSWNEKTLSPSLDRLSSFLIETFANQGLTRNQFDIETDFELELKKLN